MGDTLLAALDEEDDVGRFDARLQTALQGPGRPGLVATGLPAAPGPEESVWWPMGPDPEANALRLPGLPGPTRFADMFLLPHGLPVKA